jgi:hypothetical protein
MFFVSVSSFGGFCYERIIYWVGVSEDRDAASGAGWPELIAALGKLHLRESVQQLLGNPLRNLGVMQERHFDLRGDIADEEPECWSRGEISESLM